jgi:hypothetical protein
MDLSYRRFDVFKPATKLEIRGGDLVCRRNNPATTIVVEGRILDEFVSLKSCAADILAFANRYGFLGAPERLRRDRYWMREPLSLWVDCIQMVKALRDTAFAFKNGKPPADSDMRVIMGRNRSKFEHWSPDFVAKGITHFLRESGIHPQLFYNWTARKWALDLSNSTLVAQPPRPEAGIHGSYFIRQANTTMAAIAFFLVDEILSPSQNRARCSNPACEREYEPKIAPRKDRKNYCPTCRKRERWKITKQAQRQRAAAALRSG